MCMSAVFVLEWIVGWNTGLLDMTEQWQPICWDSGFHDHIFFRVLVEC